MHKWIFFLITAVLLSLNAVTEARTVIDASDQEVRIENTARIVSIGGDVTEIVVALGAEDQLVARDDTSYYPPAVEALPSVGYMRTLPTEGILSMNPSVVIANENAGPPTTLQQLRDANIALVLIPAGQTLETVIEKIQLVAAVLDVDDEGKALSQLLEKQHQALQESIQPFDSSPKILSFMNARRGALMAAGGGTGVEAILGLIGAKNALDGFQGYKAISTEAAVNAQPDAILLPSHGEEQMGGKEGILSIPEMQTTPAVQNNKIVVMDSLALLMFGPRYLKASSKLASHLYADYEIPEILEMKEESAEE